jgi:hypothetical protein
VKRGLILLALTTVALSLAAQAGASGRRLSAADRKAISQSIDTFVNHAVKRKDVSAAYDVTAPELRAGMTRKEWATGDIPAYPYPARGTSHGWTILYVTRDEVAVNLILRPNPGVRIRGILFNVYLRPVHGKWLVDSFMPAATINTELFGGAARVTSVRDFSPGEQSGGPHGKSLINPDVGYIPFALLALFFVGLAGALAWGAIRHRPRVGSLPPFPGTRRAR